MITGLKHKIVTLAGFLVMGVLAFAGNPDRSGQAGASELLVNPWARSVGLNSINYSNVRGIEAMRMNVAGMSYLEKTQVGFTRTEYLRGSDISFNALGFAQKMGDGALGISVMTVGFGDIEITTVNQPEGGIGTYSPQYLNIGIAYARSFADFIHGGFVFRIISESIADVSATGVALDAGLMYTTGDEAYPDRFKFGVSLRNVGTPMTFRGDGLKFRTDVITGDYQQSAGQLSQSFELPSQLNIGASYDIFPNVKNRITISGSFTSNAFYKDQFGIAFEYGLKVNNKEMFQLRAGYRYEDGLNDPVKRTSAHTGLAAGFSVNIPFSKEEKIPQLGIDYGYRTSNPYSGSHAIGFRIDF